MKGLLAYCIKKDLHHRHLHRETAGRYYIVHTNRGSVWTEKILLATNGYMTFLTSEFEDEIVSVNGTCPHIKVKDNAQPASSYLSNPYDICRDFTNHESFINRPNSTVIVGGAKPFYLKDKNVNDSTLVQGDVSGWYETLMQNLFYTWKGTQTEVDRHPQVLRQRHAGDRRDVGLCEQIQHRRVSRPWNATHLSKR